MIITESLFALAVALFLTAVFAVAGRQAKSRWRVILFSLVVFLGAWAGGIWITPVGPTILGVYWLSFFGVGLVLQLVYKPVWIGGVLVPAALRGRFPFYVAFFGGIFVTYIVGDIIAIPFGHVFRKKDGTP
jgi:hypothetical protein